MGLNIGTNVIDLIERYVRLEINKRGGVNRVHMDIELGYYEQVGVPSSWVPIKFRSMTVEGDALLFSMGMKPTQLGLKSDAVVFQSVDTMAYGLITEQLPTTATIQVGVTDGAGKPVQEAVLTVRKAGVTYLQAPVPATHVTPLLLGAEVHVDAPGFLPFTRTYPVLKGDVALTVALTPVAPEAPQ
ncbi:hypothetical protein [Deinococcus kurensis]|uniref:hypothetical protein n=1 Tax=Deinococcus kurensis TaxID=2662757 RepID=UPI0012D33768|nr:hypothetical protein [Deinococcus kurensis]